MTRATQHKLKSMLNNM